MKCIYEAVTPVYLDRHCFDLQISILKPKYIAREKAPIILVMNEEINLQLRLILEDLITQLFKLVKEDQRELWLFPFLKLLENVFTSLLQKAITKQLAQISEFEDFLSSSCSDNGNNRNKPGKWLPSEEARLEHAVRICKQRAAKLGQTLSGDLQWIAISEVVESKTPEQCKAKCVQISQKDKKPVKDEEDED